VRRAGAGLVAAGLALAAGAPALAQPRTPLQELLEYRAPRPIPQPRTDPFLTAPEPPLRFEEDGRRPGLGGPVAPPPLPTSLIGTVRASDAPGDGPVGRIRELFPAIRACWEPPGGRPGREATIRFAFRRDGTVLGEPRITYQKAGPDEDRQAFRRSVVSAVQACTPLAFRSSFGQAIAGRPVAIRFIDDRTP
jgi:hypothetical protein